MSRRTSWPVAAVAALAGACLTACVQVPSDGKVVQFEESVQGAPGENPDNNPPPPQPGMSPAQIVTGFFEAMTATPLQTSAALRYLTLAGRSVWTPQRGVVSYTGLRPPPSGLKTVRVRLRGAERIGAAGQWLGPLRAAASEVSFPMSQENGEWRIASAPDALLVPRTFYDAAFQDASLYFFDPTARILVPEVVHLPQGQQFTTALVAALLLGPRPAEKAGVSRTFLPPGLSVKPVVVRDGSADVTLSGSDPGPLGRRTTRLMLTQLAWTLRQDPTVRTFTLNLAGRQVTDASGSSTFRVDSPDTRYDPSVPNASSQLYALRRGRLVSGQANRLTPVGGPFGTDDLGIGAFAVSLHDGQVAATTASSLLVGPVRSGTQPTQVLTGQGLLRPAWDYANRLWEVQNRGPDGAVVLNVSHGRPHVVPVRGVSGEDVRRFLISRDGSRLIAVVRGARRDHLVVSRLRYDGDGRVVSGTRARPIRWAAGRGTARIRDIGWMSPTTIAVLDQVSRAQAEVRLLDVDGSMSPDEVHAIVVQGRALGLATSPASASLTTPFAVLPGELFDLAQVDTNQQQPVAGLRYITYAG